MSTLQVANLVFESTGNTWIQYVGTNTVNIVAANTTMMSINSTSISFQANGSYGTNGQILTSNGTSTFWSNVVLRVFDSSNTQVFP